MRRCLWAAAFVVTGGIIACRVILSSFDMAAGFPDLDRATSIVDGQEIEWVVGGNPNAEILLLGLHGSPGSPEMFGPLVEGFDNYALIAPARPGYGLTKPRGGTGELGEQVEIAMSLLRSFREGRRVVLVGHSYGGPIALRAALDHPDEIDAVVLVAGSVDPELEFTRPLNRVLRWPPFRWALPGKWSVSNSEIFHLKPELEDMEKRLGDLTVPLVVVQGTDDELVPAANAAYLTEHTPADTLEVEMVEGGNHFLLWEEVDIVRAAISRALNAGLQHP